MNNRKRSTIVIIVALINRISALAKLCSARKMQNITSNLLMMTALLSLAGGLACAADNVPLTPEYAAKKENHRKQQNQRITNKQRKAAADDLKAKRLEVYKAKQAVKHSKPENIDNK